MSIKASRAVPAATGRGSAAQPTRPPVRIVVMGVAGSGKSSVAEALASRFGARFVEADQFHLPASIVKMSAGIALSDEDRWPWLTALLHELTRGDDVVLACSALRKSYRDLLRRAGGIRFVYLAVGRADVMRRVESRAGHFMGTSMVDSQFATLERPGPDETDVVMIDAALPPAAVVEAASAALGATTDR